LNNKIFRIPRILDSFPGKGFPDSGFFMNKTDYEEVFKEET